MAQNVRSQEKINKIEEIRNEKNHNKEVYSALEKLESELFDFIKTSGIQPITDAPTFRLSLGSLEVMLTFGKFFLKHRMFDKFKEKLSDYPKESKAVKTLFDMGEEKDKKAIDHHTALLDSSTITSKQAAYSKKALGELKISCQCREDEREIQKTLNKRYKALAEEYNRIATDIKIAQAQKESKAEIKNQEQELSADMASEDESDQKPSKKGIKKAFV